MPRNASKPAHYMPHPTNQENQEHVEDCIEAKTDHIRDPVRTMHALDFYATQWSKSLNEACKINHVTNLEDMQDLQFCIKQVERIVKNSTNVRREQTWHTTVAQIESVLMEKGLSDGVMQDIVGDCRNPVWDLFHRLSTQYAQSMLGQRGEKYTEEMQFNTIKKWVDSENKEYGVKLALFKEIPNRWCFEHLVPSFEHLNVSMNILLLPENLPEELPGPSKLLIRALRLYNQSLNYLLNANHLTDLSDAFFFFFKNYSPKERVNTMEYNAIKSEGFEETGYNLRFHRTLLELANHVQSLSDQTDENIGTSMFHAFPLMQVAKNKLQFVAAIRKAISEGFLIINQSNQYAAYRSDHQASSRSGLAIVPASGLLTPNASY